MKDAILRCHFCGQPIMSERNAYQRVEGWVKRRVSGGTNALALRETRDEWAHNICIDRIKSGVVPEQETLF